MTIQQSDVQDFLDKVLASNKQQTSSKPLDVDLGYTIPKDEPLQIASYDNEMSDIKYASIGLKSYTEKQDDEERHTHVQYYLVLFGHDDLSRNAFEHRVNTAHRIFTDVTYDEIVDALRTLIATHLLPKFLELRLPLSKDYWIMK